MHQFALNKINMSKHTIKSSQSETYCVRLCATKIVQDKTRLFRQLMTDPKRNWLECREPQQSTTYAPLLRGFSTITSQRVISTFMMQTRVIWDLNLCRPNMFICQFRHLLIQVVADYFQGASLQGLIKTYLSATNLISSVGTQNTSHFLS